MTSFKELQAEKKLLVAESETYRQLLKMEIQTFKVYGSRTRQRLGSFRTYLPLIMSGIPVLAGLFSQKKRRDFSLKRLGVLFALGWKAYRKFGPLMGFSRSRPGNGQTGQTAAQEYLSKRL